MAHPDRPMIVRGSTAGGPVRINASFRSEFGFDAEELAEKPLLDWIEPADLQQLRALLEAGEGSCRARHKVQAGRSICLVWKVRSEPEGPMALGLMGPSLRASNEPESEATEGTVTDTLETIARIVEEQNRGYKCSILLLDKPGRAAASGGGPSLPVSYNSAVEGLKIGPLVGSCGTAAYWNVPVILEDIQADVLWRELAPLAKEAGVASCWSHPFSSRAGRVLGALALCCPEPSAPTAEQLSRLRTAARLTGLAVERARAEEALRESEAEAQHQRRRQAELEEQLRQAEKLEALGVLAGGIAHDFNNLLASVQGNAELAMKLLPQGAEPLRMLRQIMKASHRASDLCTQMLAYAGRGKRQSRRVEVNELLTDLGGLLSVEFSKNVYLDYALHAKSIYVQADQSQLEQVVVNLVTNATEALGDDGGRILIATELRYHDAEVLARLAPGRALPAGDFVCIIVSDTGEGMEPDTQARIFDPFFTTKFTGRGLGLAAAEGIVRGHGGLIHLSSEQGAGTTFTVVLPSVEVPESDDPPDSHEATPTCVRKRVLVVDDEADLRQLFGTMLAHAGFEVLKAAGADEAISLLCEDPSAIDCVLLDLSMPGRDGEDTYLELRAIRADLPVVLISGFSEEEVLARFRGAELAGVLPKPVPVAELVGTIRRATLVS